MLVSFRLMNRFPLLIVAGAVAVSVLVTTATPVSAADTVLDGTGVVHAGFYPEQFFSGGASGLGDDLGPHAAATGKRVSLAGYFMDVTHNPAPGSDRPGTFNNTIVQLNEVWAGQATPFVNLFVGSANTSAIASGSQDPFIDRWAGYLKRWLEGENLSGTSVPVAGRSIILAPLPEMNWTGGEAYQCQPATFVGAYERIVDRVELILGPTTKEQVRWAFAPNNATGAGCGSIASYYPNAAKVDFTAFSAYNFFGFAGPNTSPFQVMSGPITELKAVAPAKPIIVAQTASCNNNATRATWIKDMFGLLAADANVVGFVWFNINKECDWRVWYGATGGVDGAWDTALDSATYSHPIADWFVPGTTLAIAVSDTADPCPAGAKCDSVALIDGTGPGFSLYLRATALSPKNEFIFGNPGDVPLMGDWNCDMVDTPGMYRQSNGLVYLTDANASGNANRQFFLGDPGDFPIVGDFNGDGCDTVSLYRPSTQQFFIANKLAGDGAGIVADSAGFVFGNPGDKPFSGDLDGDGIDEVALHRESTGFVYYRFTLNTGIADREFFFGDPNDIIEAGDWNGDGTDTVAVYRPGNGTVYLKLANVQGNADFSFFVGPGKVGFGTAPHSS